MKRIRAERHKIERKVLFSGRWSTSQLPPSSPYSQPSDPQLSSPNHSESPALELQVGCVVKAKHGTRQAGSKRVRHDRDTTKQVKKLSCYVSPRKLTESTNTKEMLQGKQSQSRGPNRDRGCHTPSGNRFMEAKLLTLELNVTHVVCFSLGFILSSWGLAQS